MEKYLVLGANGFIGGKLKHTLRRNGSEVHGIGRTECDLRNLDQCLELINDIHPTIVFNFAAHVGSVHYGLSHEADIVHDNSIMLLNLYKSVTSLNNVLIINPISNCTYAADLSVQSEVEWWSGAPHRSALPYAMSKRLSFVIGASYESQHGIKTNHLILPGIYGPGDHTEIERVHALDGMIIRMLLASKNNEKTFSIWGTGSPVREWCYIDDLINILIRASHRDFNLKGPLNVAQNNGYSIKELGEFIASAVGFQGSLIFDKSYVDGAAVKILDNTLFREFFPDYEFVDIRAGIEESVAYYREQLSV